MNAMCLLAGEKGPFEKGPLSPAPLSPSNFIHYGERSTIQNSHALFTENRHSRARYSKGSNGNREGHI